MFLGLVGFAVLLGLAAIFYAIFRRKSGRSLDD